MTLAQNINRALTTSCHFDLISRIDQTNYVVSKHPFRQPGSSRPAWVRLNNILSILKTGEAFNRSSLSKLTRCCTKTIQRDINCLRWQGVKIKFDFDAGTYRLTGPIPAQFGITPGL